MGAQHIDHWKTKMVKMLQGQGYDDEYCEASKDGWRAQNGRQQSIEDAHLLVGSSQAIDCTEAGRLRRCNIGILLRQRLLCCL